MRLEVFGKTRLNKEGKQFTTWLSRITNMKTGEIIPIQIKFRMTAELPKDFPVVMNIDKSACNLVKEDWKNDEGETGVKYILWVTKVKSYEPYVDHSLDDYE